MIGMVFGVGVGGVGVCFVVGEDWYVGVGIEGVLGFLVMFCCKFFIKDKSVRN